MARDEHTNNSSGGGGGGGSGGDGGGGGGGGQRSSKKLKHKKVPQRGMGVAQLEKIISEEQQKKDAAFLTPSLIISPSNSSSNLANIQKVPSFRPPSSSSSIPLPPPLPPNSAPFSKPMNMNAGSGGGSWCRLLSDGDFNFEGEKQNQNHGMDHHRYTAAFPANLVGLPYESNPPILSPSPNLMIQRSKSMVNVPSGTSSSVMNFLEPPSNQSYCGNNYHPLWPEEEKMVGMKRPYPFSLENAPIPSFHCKYPSAYVSPVAKSDESASCNNGGCTTSIEPAHSLFRETPSSLGAVSDTITKKFIDENQGLTRDFLKLAPPQSSASKEKLQSLPCIEEHSFFEISPPQKGQSTDPTNLSGRSGSTQQPFFSFLPAAKTHTGQSGHSNGETGESIDLNLKL